MGLVFKLVGFDRRTDDVAVEYPIPAAAVPAALAFAHAAGKPESELADLPLSDSDARAIAALLQRDLDTEACLFILEISSDQPLPRAAVAGRKVR